MKRAVLLLPILLFLSLFGCAAVEQVKDAVKPANPNEMVRQEPKKAVYRSTEDQTNERPNIEPSQKVPGEPGY